MFKEFAAGAMLALTASTVTAATIDYTLGATVRVGNNSTVSASEATVRRQID